MMLLITFPLRGGQKVRHLARHHIPSRKIELPDFKAHLFIVGQAACHEGE
jgi:hypothetical protein